MVLQQKYIFFLVLDTGKENLFKIIVALVMNSLRINLFFYPKTKSIIIKQIQREFTKSKQVQHNNIKKIQYNTQKHKQQKKVYIQLLQPTNTIGIIARKCVAMNSFSI